VSGAFEIEAISLLSSGRDGFNRAEKCPKFRGFNP